MVITAAVIHDGYIEQFLCFTGDSASILRIRAVRGANGKFKPIVRDMVTGIALAVGGIPDGYDDPQDCLRVAQDLAIGFITENIEKVVPL